MALSASGASRWEEAPARPWHVRGRILLPQAIPLLMGILNVTPDSFSDGGKFLDHSRALARARDMIAEGCAIIDIGGESTRPGAQPVDADEELRRVLPVIEKLAAETGAVISIDTTKARVAREALSAGASIVNDISGLTFDPEMAAACAEFSSGVICMHIQGTPQTMQNAPTYTNVVEEVAGWLERRVAELTRGGIVRESLAIDPGIGFGKSAEHNVQILSNIARFQQLELPICVGHSRKRFLQKVLGRTAEHPVDERLFGTVGIAVGLALAGVEVLRIHDVAAVRDAIVACRTIVS
jgi:dihydropteroate synthase